ncbi:DUF488 domain-containing protein [Dyella sp. BiH032]|uniref:DUF488 domain-containing protein n=1 Tax=Dyella sp. BiH032 TaxID=3075430 RepID=UPI002892D095|nr:DUF488 domain-containing protein [Dyella sp. BiH032]WNL44332.1 DUF488 domain-containing protein [Dyella sp. BiH032]
MTPPFFTIGHSNRSLDAFIALLRESEVRRVVDVRAFPRSRTNPAFNADSLPIALADHAIAYRHLAALGGRRGKSDTVPVEVNCFWTHPSFHHYADYALSAPFRAGLDELVAMGRRERCAVMCSEAVWWRCHRRIVTDYLLARGETVFHILAAGHVDAARLTEGAVVRPDRSITYPAADLFGPQSQAGR